MKDDPSGPITPAFVSHLQRSLWGMGVMLVAVFALVTDRLVRHVTHHDLVAVAQFVQSSLEPGELGELIESRPSYRGAWLWATAGFAAVIGVASWLISHRLERWFHRGVSEPLNALLDSARRDDDSESERGRPAALDAHKASSREMQELAEFVTKSKAHVRRIEREAQRQIREQEIGFGRVLRRAEDLATTDSLTGLKNRTFLAAELQGILARQRERDDDLAAVMIDVDNFKLHNDTLGHKAGDDLLRFVGELLRGSIRPHDHAIRYAGDEFLLLLTGVGQKQAATIMQRMVKLFAQYAATLRVAKPPSISAGIATLKESPTDDGPALIVKADRALYAAKRKGKNSVETCAAAC